MAADRDDVRPHGFVQFVAEVAMIVEFLASVMRAIGLMSLADRLAYQAASAEDRRRRAKAVERSDQLPPDPGPLRAAVARSPEDPSARRRLGWGRLGAKEYDEALEVFHQGCRDFPEDADLLYGFALAAKQLGKVDLADEAFLKAAAAAEAMADPGRSEILHRLAMGHHNYLRNGRWGLKREIWGGD